MVVAANGGSVAMAQAITWLCRPSLRMADTSPVIIFFIARYNNLKDFEGGYTEKNNVYIAVPICTSKALSYLGLRGI